MENWIDEVFYLEELIIGGGGVRFIVVCIDSVESFVNGWECLRRECGERNESLGLRLEEF